MTMVTVKLMSRKSNRLDWGKRQSFGTHHETSHAAINKAREEAVVALVAWSNCGCEQFTEFEIVVE